MASGVPILEGLNITRETAGNALFERMYGKVTDAIREGETIAKPMKENSKPGFHPVAMFFWCCLGRWTVDPHVLPARHAADRADRPWPWAAPLGGLWYSDRMNAPLRGRPGGQHGGRG